MYTSRISSIVVARRMSRMSMIFKKKEQEPHTNTNNLIRTVYVSRSLSNKKYSFS